MNRKQRRDQNREMIKDLPVNLTEVPKERWGGIPEGQANNRIQVFNSKKFLVQVFQEEDGIKRMSVNRCQVKADGNWSDDISWDELQQIKRDIGYGDEYAIEIYPPDLQVVNVANLRHLWILPEPLKIGWLWGL